MRVDVKKFLFVGLEEEKGLFFKKAQEAGIVHFINPSKAKAIPTEISNVTAAIKVLRSLPTIEQETSEEFSNADSLVVKILYCKNTIESLLEELRILHLEIARVAVFGDFSTEDIRAIEQQTNRKIQFFFAKKGAVENLPDEVLFVGSDHGLDYFFAIMEQPRQIDGLVEMHIEQPLGILQKRVKACEKELQEIENDLKSYAKYNQFLHHALMYKLNAYHLHTAENEVQEIDNSLFAIEGWVPVNQRKAAQALVEEMNVHIEEIAIEPTDFIPTYLENEGVNKIGEDVMRVYDIPSPSDKDPSLWVLVSFSFFFAFIIGDAGYGLIFLAAALYMRYKFTRLNTSKRRLLNLFTILCAACIGWGLLTNAFFGISFGVDSPMRKISILHWLVEKKAAYHFNRHDSVYDHWKTKYPAVEEIKTPDEFIRSAVKITDGSTSYPIVDKFSDNILMEMALLIGVIHIIISLLRYLNRNWSNLGWILFIIGGYLYFPFYLGATSILDFVFNLDPGKVAHEGLTLIAIGVSFAVICAIFKNKLLGLLELMTSVQIFSDILSYLRLYALALAGSIVSATINDLFGSVTFVIAVIIVILGHSINILLSVMSGVIHGLRLNFLEWYHYSFDGGGKLFQPLKKIKID